MTSLSALRRCFLLLCIGSMLIPTAAPVACELSLIAELPIEIKGKRGLRPVVKASINGVEGDFVFDTGGGASMVAQASAAKFGLSMNDAQRIRMRSVGQEFDADALTVKELRLGA